MELPGAEKGRGRPRGAEWSEAGPVEPSWCHKDPSRASGLSRCHRVKLVPGLRPSRSGLVEVSGAGRGEASLEILWYIASGPCLS